MTLRIAVPDGALRAPSLRILAAVGVSGGDSPPAASASPGLEARVVVIAADDVPSYLANGVADAGLVAKDVLLERATGLCELLDLRFGGRCSSMPPRPARRRAPSGSAACASPRAIPLSRARTSRRAASRSRSSRSSERSIAPPPTGWPTGWWRSSRPRPGAVAPGRDAPVGAAQAHIEGLTVEGVVAESSVRLVAGRGARVLHSAELGQLVGRLRDLTTKAATT